jgi:hypothetical protein
MPAENQEILQGLLDLYDEAFVVRAYQVILGRPPDPGGLQNYLRQVREGVHKAQIVSELAESAEGRSRHLDLPGLPDLIARYRKRSPSLWHRLAWRLTRGANESTENHLRAIDNKLHVVQVTLQAQGRQLSELMTAMRGNRHVALGIAAESDQSVLRALHPKVAATFQELKSAISERHVS